MPQAIAIIKTVFNLVTAVVLVLKFGLVGVAVGTLVAMVYQTCYLAWYIKALCPIQKLHATTYFGWSILALKTIALGIPAIATVNTVFYYPKITRYIKKQ